MSESINNNEANNQTVVNKENIDLNSKVLEQQNKIDNLTKELEMLKKENQDRKFNGKFRTQEEYENDLKQARMDIRKEYDNSIDKDVSLKMKSKEEEMNRQITETQEQLDAQRNTIVVSQAMDKIKTYFIDNGCWELYQEIDKNPSLKNTLKSFIKINDVKVDLIGEGKTKTAQITSSTNSREVAELLLAVIKKAKDIAVDAELAKNTNILAKTQKNHENTEGFSADIASYANQSKQDALREAFEK